MEESQADTEKKLGGLSNVTDDHASMAQSPTAMEAVAGPSTSTTDKKHAFGKAPKRKNIRHVLDLEEFGSEALEEQKREQERQQRVQMMLASRLQQHQLQLQQQHQRQQQMLRMHAYHQPQPLPFFTNLTDREKADIIARQAVWRDFRNSSKYETGDDDIVLLSSDDEGKDRKPNEVKRFKQSGGSDSDNDDSDCIVLDSGDEEEHAESTDETATSAHINDAFNVPDADGRVLVNVGHAEAEPDIFLPQHLVKVIKPHQIGGLRFMYDNIVESVQKFNPNGGFGCILAHSMGLGKTFQVVAFTSVIYHHTPLKRVLLIVPVNTLHNWLQEFEMWLPKSSFQRDVAPRQFDVSVIADGCKTWASRVAVIDEWYKRSGILVLGYEMFRMLTNKIGGLNSKKSKQGCKNDVAATQESKKEEEGNIDFKEVAKALLDPGPDLVICDEGHRIKNFQSHTSKALSTIRTKRRIVLTGYPLQNNLMEYWCMVNFVRPNYLGTRQEFASVFERPIKNGQCVDSTEKDIRIMRFRVHVLTNLLKGFVQRRSHALLSTTLPEKSEYVLFVRKSPIQHRLYRRFIVQCTADMRDDLGSWNPLKAFAVCCKIWNHPDVLYKALRDHVDAVDGDLDLEGPGRGSPPSANWNETLPSSSSSSLSSLSNGFFQFRVKKETSRHIDYRWAEDLFENYNPGIIENGMKMRLALKIIEHSVRRNDKILLFSQSLLTLNAVESFLNVLKIPGSDDRWKKNRSYFRLDGSTNSIERQRLIARFNNERGVHLFLISTRAGSLGINLVGANRVIVFDASFNPCHDAQAVCRVYRYGQKKSTYIYRLIADNSMEKTIFNRQLGKQGIADRVIDERAMDAALCRQDLYDLLQYNEEQDMITEDCKINPENLKDELLWDICNDCVDCFAKAPVPHESLMLDRGDQKLSDEEKREAKRGYEREKRMMKQQNNGGIDWKRYHSDRERTGRQNCFGDSMPHSQRNWADFGPPPIRSTPMPMMLQSTSYPQLPHGGFTSSYPQMANGSCSTSYLHLANEDSSTPYPQLTNGGPATPAWQSPIQHLNASLVGSAVPFPGTLVPFPNPVDGQMPPQNTGPPELITLSDDEA